jgi:hypothetical protein
VLGKWLISTIGVRRRKKMVIGDFVLCVTRVRRCGQAGPPATVSEPKAPLAVEFDTPDTLDSPQRTTLYSLADGRYSKPHDASRL